MHVDLLSARNLATSLISFGECVPLCAGPRPSGLAGQGCVPDFLQLEGLAAALGQFLGLGQGFLGTRLTGCNSSPGEASERARHSPEQGAVDQNQPSPLLSQFP